MKIMKLMTQELRAKLPALGATENQPIKGKIVQASYFTPDSNWYWYPIEFDGEDILWGAVAGQYFEFGCFSLAELAAIRGTWGLPVERDKYWTPVPVIEVIKRHQDREGAALWLA